MTDLVEQGLRIEYARNGLGYRQEELAEKLQAEGIKISAPTISRIEDGSRGVWDHEMDALVVILEQSREWLSGKTPFEEFRAKKPFWMVGQTTYRPLLHAA